VLKNNFISIKDVSFEILQRNIIFFLLLLHNLIFRRHHKILKP